MADQAEMMSSLATQRAAFPGYGGGSPRTMCWKPTPMASAIAPHLGLLPVMNVSLLFKEQQQTHIHEPPAGPEVPGGVNALLGWLRPG